jgi:hypothetical protein
MCATCPIHTTLLHNISSSYTVYTQVQEFPQMDYANTQKCVTKHLVSLAKKTDIRQENSCLCIQARDTHNGNVSSALCSTIAGTLAA